MCLWHVAGVCPCYALAGEDRPVSACTHPPFAFPSLQRVAGPKGVEKLLGVYTYDVFFPRAGRIDLPTYTLCNRRVTDVGCVSYMQS